MAARNRLHVAILIPTVLVLVALGLAWTLGGSTAQGQGAADREVQDMVTDTALTVSSVAPAAVLTFVEFHKDGVNGVDGLNGTTSVKVSPHGSHLYASGDSDDAVAVFSRNSATGSLTFVEVHKDGVDGVDGLSGASSVTVSPDGSHLYAAGYSDDAVVVFSASIFVGNCGP